MKQNINIFKEQDDLNRKQQFTLKFVQAINQSENTRFTEKTWQNDEECNIIDLPEPAVREKL